MIRPINITDSRNSSLKIFINCEKYRYLDLVSTYLKLTSPREMFIDFLIFGIFVIDTCASLKKICNDLKLKRSPKKVLVPLAYALTNIYLQGKGYMVPMRYGSWYIFFKVLFLHLKHFLL